jgi:heat shock protein HtpX
MMQTTGVNIYDQQARNRRMTVAVMLGFGAFVAFLGFGVDVFLLGSISDEAFFPIGTIGGVLAGSLSALWSLKGGAKAVLAAAGAQPVHPGNPQHQQLINVVDEMRIASGLPMPQVYVIPDPDPNAFATGTTPDTSVVAVTEGLLSSLNREELQGVIAHEMSHIRNYDMRLMTVVAALVGTVLVLSDMATRSMRFGGGSRSKNKSSGGAGTGILFVVWIIAIILAPLIGRMLAMMVSRRREYLADASAAELTRNPLGLASALEKLNSAVAPTTTIRKGSAHLCIVDPTGNAMNAKEGAVADLFGTHPPIELRIEALKQMAYERTQVKNQKS